MSSFEVRAILPPFVSTSLRIARLSRSSFGRLGMELWFVAGVVWRICWSKSAGRNGSSECSQTSGAVSKKAISL